MLMTCDISLPIPPSPYHSSFSLTLFHFLPLYPKSFCFVFQGDDAGIDWGGDDGDIQIDVVADDSGAQAITAVTDDVARGSDALTLLDNVELRGEFINELLEVMMT